MTTDEVLIQATGAIDATWAIARSSTERVLRAHGASAGEITAALKDQEVTWLKERAQMLSRLSHEFAEF